MSGTIFNVVGPPIELMPATSISVPPKSDRPEAIVPTIVPSVPVPATLAAGINLSSVSAVRVASALTR
ncbi:hypothetical protein LzC2_17960 [Planctomycetes bacterium LzC2]|uniref:Uncharacterized protein n=1 Tax=Alienimonas chondri TaxID=2681879 RepID=A0ABX1VC89_9PLAN|nr:hypothetical protein [Alienimonas chondri]